MSIAFDLERLQRLLDQGALSQVEFNLAKERLLRPRSIRTFFGVDGAANVSESEGRVAAQVFHLLAIPPLAIWFPLPIWLLLRKRYSVLDQHAPSIFNWLLTLLVLVAPAAFLVSGIITFAFIAPATWYFGLAIDPLSAIPEIAIGGIFLIGFALPLIAAYQIGQGQSWKYPYAIPFFRYEATQAAPLSNGTQQPTPAESNDILAG
jgi:uncharacterized Tic20 family protein